MRQQAARGEISLGLKASEFGTTRLTPHHEKGLKQYRTKLFFKCYRRWLLATLQDKISNRPAAAEVPYRNHNGPAAARLVCHLAAVGSD